MEPSTRYSFCACWQPSNRRAAGEFPLRFRHRRRFESSGLLIITFDEGNQADLYHGGGQVPTLIVASNVKPGFQSQTFYQHQSTLRLILASSGVSTFPGLAATAPDMTEFFIGY